MFPFQRRRHRLIWYVLLLTLPLVWLASIKVIPLQPAESPASGPTSFSAGLMLGDATEDATILLSFDAALRVPTILVYLKESEADAPQEGLLLGKLESPGDYKFSVPKPLPSPMYISGYDPIHQSTVFNLSLN